MPQVAFRAGDWLAVPLRDGRWVPARIARAHGHQIFLYVFARPAPDPPSLDDVTSLRADDSGYQIMTSALGVEDGTWHVLGGADGFDPAEWPLPEFERRVDAGGKVVRFADRFDEVRLGRLVDSRKVPDSDTTWRPESGLAGSGVAEAAITRWVQQTE